MYQMNSYVVKLFFKKKRKQGNDYLQGEGKWEESDERSMTISGF